MVVEDGWANVHEGRAGGGGRVGWMSGGGDRDVDVESSLLGGLAEMQEREAALGAKRGHGGLVGLIKRRRVFMASFLGVLLLIAGSIVGEIGSSGKRVAREVCEGLSAEETPFNRASEWLGWASAVKEVYLKHRAPTAQLSSSQENDALRCARGGWQTVCTEQLFGHDSSPQQSELERIGRDRRMLEDEYKQAISSVPEPEANELRLSASEALKFKRGVAEAELSVCKMPPVDSECIEARSEELKVIDAVAAQLRRAVAQATGKGGRMAGDVKEGSPSLVLLRKIGDLIREQKVHDVLRQRSWRTLNAVSAVILDQVLQRSVGARGGALPWEDVMLFEGKGQVQYVGSFRGLRYHGQGTLYYPGGEVAYTGSWQDGRMHGTGVLRHRGGGIVWKGTFQEGWPSSGLFW